MYLVHGLSVCGGTYTVLEHLPFVDLQLTLSIGSHVIYTSLEKITVVVYNLLVSEIIVC